MEITAQSRSSFKNKKFKAKKYKIINQIDTIGEILKKIKLIEEFEKSHEI